MNDNSPEFYPRHYFLSVSETSRPGDEFGAVSATDKDEGKNAEVTYFFVSTVPDFEVDPQTGVLRLSSSPSASLSRKKRQHYRLVVSAKDAGNRKALEDAIVHVTVASAGSDTETSVKFSTDEDGHAFYVVEDSGEAATVASKLNSSPREIGRVAVTGQVPGANPEFFIVDGDPERIFDVRTSGNTGVVETRRKIDRETAAEYRLRVVALFASSDGAMFVETWVNVTVEDVNDHAPSFDQSRAVARVLEDSPIGHEVFLAKARDADDGENARITYDLTSNPGDVFYVSPRTGMVHLNKRIGLGAGDGEPSIRVYNLEVQATDAG